MSECRCSRSSGRYRSSRFSSSFLSKRRSESISTASKKKRAGGISLAANLVSTLVGIPVAWIVLVFIEIGCGFALRFDMNSSALPQRILQETVGAAWMNPPEALPKWSIPVGAIFLCIPFCLMSVWSEYLIARAMLGEENRSRALSWAWKANLASYALMSLGFLGWLIVVMTSPKSNPLAP